MLLTSGEMIGLSGDFKDAFDTFSFNRSIVVHKEPIKTPRPSFSNNGGLFGLGNSQTDTQYNYTPVNSSFSAVIRYKSNINESSDSEMDAFFSKGGAAIMVERACHDYIMLNKTEKIDFDGRSWKVMGMPRAKKYFFNDYYIFYVQHL